MHHKILSPKWRLFSRGRWVRSCNHLPLWIASSFFPHLQKHQLEPKHCPLSSPLTQKGPNGAKLNRPTGLLLTMFPSSYHHEILRSYYQWQKWRPCKRSRSKVKVTEVTTQLNRFRTVTPVWIHIWWWNDAYSLTMLRRGALLFLKVIRQISRSHGSKNRRIWPRLGVSGL